jgi:uncharacterized protein (UPF0264 family)
LMPLAIDILDLKNPARGALGALDVEEVRRIVRAFPGQTLSATIGDLPMLPDRIYDAVDAMARTGVDFVKIGFFASGNWQAILDGLKPITHRGVKLIAVLFGDQPFSLEVIPAFKAAGFHGIMVDTAEKTGGGLLHHHGVPWLRQFVAVGHEMGCLTGLAGSLTLQDISTLKPLGADYLGFRGALCAEGRTGQLDLASALRIHAAIKALD